MARQKFDDSDFLNTALAIAADGGPAMVTVGAITDRLKATTGSFYHRFASRNALLGELWLRTVLEFRHGIREALDDGDGLGACLHTPAWARLNLDKARLLLLYHRDDFVQGEWPDELRQGVAAQAAQIKAGTARFARLVFGHDGAEDLRRAQFLLAEVPLAVVGQHLRRREPPPHIVDALIRITFRAVVEERRNVILLGPPGVGKTHLGIALGVAATEAGYRTYFTSAADMVQSLQSAHLEGTALYKLRTYTGPTVLVIDELGCAPRGADVPCGLRGPPPVVAAAGRS